MISNSETSETKVNVTERNGVTSLEVELTPDKAANDTENNVERTQAEKDSLKKRFIELVERTYKYNKKAYQTNIFRGFVLLNDGKEEKPNKGPRDNKEKKDKAGDGGQVHCKNCKKTKDKCDCGDWQPVPYKTKDQKENKAK